MTLRRGCRWFHELRPIDGLGPIAPGTPVSDGLCADCEQRTIMMTICGKCEHEWSTDSGQQICPACGNDGSIEGHVQRSQR